jgi:hypothetical protein
VLATIAGETDIVTGAIKPFGKSQRRNDVRFLLPPLHQKVEPTTSTKNSLDILGKKIEDERLERFSQSCSERGKPDETLLPTIPTFLDSMIPGL